MGGAGPDYAAIAGALAAEGLTARGGFHPEPADGVPPCGAASGTGTLVLVGDVGGRMWPAFSATREEGPDPLDRWTRRVVDRVAERLGARPLYPFEGPPYLPFQRWAQRAEPVAPSPVGVLIHPEYGLWHAYRAALALTERIDVPAHAVRPVPCATCRDRPCLHTCPVGAFGADGYDVERCVDHVASEAGTACRDHGCLARRSCPVDRYAYGPAQQAFHMGAFLRARLKAREARR